MPRFNLSEEEIKIVADYITLVLVDDEVIAREDLGEITSDNVERGKKIYNEKGCQACHQIGIEGGAVGPNLSVAGDRLTPEYIYMHLKDPQKWGSSNVAPNYGLDDEELTYLTKYLSDLRAKKVGFLWKIQIDTKKVRRNHFFCADSINVLCLSAFSIFRRGYSGGSIC